MKREIPTKSYLTIFIFVLGLILNINKSHAQEENQNSERMEQELVNISKQNGNGWQIVI